MKKQRILILNVLALVSAGLVSSCSNQNFKSQLQNTAGLDSNPSTPDLKPTPPPIEGDPSEKKPTEPKVVITVTPTDPSKPPVIVTLPTGPGTPTTVTPPITTDKVITTTTTGSPDGFKWEESYSAQMSPIAWDTTSTRSQWTKFIYKVIASEEPRLLESGLAKDIELFCPRFNQLNKIQKLNFWGQFLAALAYKESTWSPVSRSIERKKVVNPETGEVTYKYMGVDKVTGQYVVSEGLLQLSYQDENSYRIDCGFDWSKDKHLAEKDPRKTILNPYLNLRCGIKILSRQLQKSRSIILKNPYWAPLSANPKYNKVAYISDKTKSLSFCQ